MAVATSTIAAASLGMSVLGAASSAVGAHAGARGQQLALRSQAQMDLANAKTNALALDGQADLAGINAQADFNASVASAEFSALQAEGQAMDLRARAAIGSARSAASIIGLETGAIIDDNNAMLLELQAQSTLRRGEHKEQDARMQFAEAKSKATARMAKGNIDLSQGAGLSVRVGHDLMAENTAIRIQQAVLMDAFGQRVQSANEKISAAGKRGQAAAIASASAMESAFALANADFTERMGRINADASKALAAAGLLGAQADVDYRHAMADIMRDNASVAAMVQTSMAGSISPGMAAFTSLLGSAGQVASSWYAYRRAGG